MTAAKLPRDRLCEPLGHSPRTYYDALRERYTRNDHAMQYDTMSPAARATAARAASQFLLKHDFVSLEEAGEALELTLQQLWDRIMEEAGLPACEVPSFALVV